MDKQEPGRRLSSPAEEGHDSGTLELPTGCAGNSGGVARGHSVGGLLLCDADAFLSHPVSNPSSTPHPTSNVVPFLG